MCGLYLVLNSSSLRNSGHLLYIYIECVGNSAKKIKSARNCADQRLHQNSYMRGEASTSVLRLSYTHTHTHTHTHMSFDRPCSSDRCCFAGQPDGTTSRLRVGSMSNTICDGTLTESHNLVCGCVCTQMHHF